ncbi:Protein of unknown function [Jannaschia faecimaris]|uniref:DUF3750 domain-containing protein n=1 Tax=Jannaschia faecimaris TaxID=1244108 RepID=A0A1H3MQQ4_9RHOB|nr:DUF3750 domain-containing protein [Jannaschia faecimaris]SDY78768.1 Protein of unknown function [Jannaschia faecimaris]
MIRRVVARLFLAFTLCFLLPMTAATIWWTTVDRPGSWRAADWASAGVLPAADTVSEATIHVMAARTGGLKGAASVHSWLVWKPADATTWTRAEVVGWGNPVRRDAYAPDARWYSNAPYFVGSITGRAAAALIPRIEATVDAYPFGFRGAYVIWPGPNSNTFVAHVLREVPAIGIALPPHAVGKDYIGDGLRAHLDAGGDLHLSAWGYAGLSFGPRRGMEINLLGQTFGIDILQPALKLPGIGRVGT